MSQGYLTRKELANRFKCSVSTIRRMEKRGQLPAVRLTGRIVRFDLAAVLEMEGQAASEPVRHAVKPMAA